MNAQEKKYARQRLEEMAKLAKFNNIHKLPVFNRSVSDGELISDVMLGKAIFKNGCSVYDSVRTCFVAQADAEIYRRTMKERVELEASNAAIGANIDQALQTALDEIMLGKDGLQAIEEFKKAVANV